MGLQVEKKLLEFLLLETWIKFRELKMPGHRSKSGKSIGIFILGCVLFGYPILSMFNLKVAFYGIPLLYIYIFAVWIGLIFLIYFDTKTLSNSKITKLPDTALTTDPLD